MVYAFSQTAAAKKGPLRGSLKSRPTVSTVPFMGDGLSTLYQDLLSGSYDCVDRIVLAWARPRGVEKLTRGDRISQGAVHMDRSSSRSGGREGQV